MNGADRVFTNARFYTLVGNSESRPVEALATWQGRILSVGTHHEVIAHVGPSTEVLDLGGAVVLPGFIETHMHPLAAGVQMSAPQLGTPPCSPIDEVVAALAERATVTPAGSPIQAWGFDDSLIDDNRHLTLNDLDRATKNHPVLVRHISGHLSYANSTMLKLAGVTEDVADPAGGHFVRDEQGRLTGEMHETANFDVAAAIPHATLEELAAGAKAISDRCLERGVTSVTDAAVFSSEMYSSYQDAIDNGDFKVRARLFPMWRSARSFPFRTGLGGDRLSLGAMKFISDGSIQGYTACLCKGYYDRPDVTGTEVIPAAELIELVGEGVAWPELARAPA